MQLKVRGDAAIAHYRVIIEELQATIAEGRMLKQRRDPKLEPPAAPVESASTKI
jgi:hypothetical protein